MEKQEPKKRVTIWIRKPVLKDSQHVAIDKELSLSELVEQLLEREIKEKSASYSVATSPRQKQPA
jgi:hypothetical protein